MLHFLNSLSILGYSIRSFLKWILIAILTGLLIGGVGTLFHILLDEATILRETYSWLILFLPLGGIVIAYCYKLCNMSNDRGTNLILLAVRDNKELTLKTTILIFGSTIITHLFGGSSGREGAALQIGGSISSQLGKILNLDEKDKRIITMCGMSAGFAALFGTPLTAAIFAMEVATVGVMHYSAMVPCLLSAIFASKVALFFGLEPQAFKILSVPQLTLSNIVEMGLIAILFSALSILFCFAMHQTSNYYKKFFPNTIIRIAVGGVIVVVLTYILGTHDYNGAGVDIIHQAFEGDVSPFAFILKIIFTALTLGAGFKGGEIVPSFFIGATFGNTISKFFKLNSSFCAGLGLIAVFSAVTNCPITSIFMSIELFGSEGLIFFAVICAISYMLSGYSGLYDEQRILYSKLKPLYIDKKIEE